MAQGKKTTDATRAERIFALYQFLTRNTCKGHSVAVEKETYEGQVTLYGYLRSLNMDVSINTLYNDLRLLEMPPFNLQVRYDRHQHGYYVENPPFERHELRLIIDGIQSAKFITQEKAREITKKIRGLAGIEDDNLLKREAFITDRVRSMNESVVKDADKIHEAIAANRQISFRYFHRTPDRKEKVKYTKEGKVTIVSPFALLWDNGNYYLYAYVSEEKKFRTYRVDRMDRISDPLIAERDGVDKYKEREILHKNAVVFDMYHGKECSVTFRCHKHMTDSVVDVFGTQITMLPRDEDHFAFTAKVELSPPFYAWVATFGHSIVIESPDAAVKGMKDFLQRAADMYESKEGKA